MSILAVVAVSLATGTWFGIRWAEAKHKVQDLTSYIVSIPNDEWKR